MGGSGGDAPYVPPNATPIAGVPIAGQGGTGGGGSNVNPYDYGMYQSFLPDIPAEGMAPSAGGLTSDMFRYEAPSETLAPGSVPTPTPAAAANTPAGPYGVGAGAAPQGVNGPSLSGGGGGLPQITASPVGSGFQEYIRQRDALAKAMAAQQAPAPTSNPAPTPPAASQTTPDWMSVDLTR